MSCTIPECGRTVRARQLCAAHYARAARHGDPQALTPVRDVSAPHAGGKHFKDDLPAGYYSDVPVRGAATLLGAVITCPCGDLLGPVHNAAAAALAIHSHQARSHRTPGRRHDYDAT